MESNDQSRKQAGTKEELETDKVKIIHFSLIATFANINLKYNNLSKKNREIDSAGGLDTNSTKRYSFISPSFSSSSVVPFVPQRCLEPNFRDPSIFCCFSGYG